MVKMPKLSNPFNARSPKGWGLLLLYYLGFYAIIGGFYAAMMGIFIATLPSTHNGSGLKPQPTDPLRATLAAPRYTDTIQLALLTPTSSQSKNCNGTITGCSTTFKQSLSPIVRNNGEVGQVVPSGKQYKVNCSVLNGPLKLTNHINDKETPSKGKTAALPVNNVAIFTANGLSEAIFASILTVVPDGTGKGDQQREGKAATVYAGTVRCVASDDAGTQYRISRIEPSFDFYTIP